MRFNPQLLSDLTKEYEQELRTAPRSEVGKCVEENLSAWIPRGYSDIDELLYSGATVGRVRPECIDEYVERWLGPNPSELHLDIASLFLWGYWPFADHICKPLVSRLLDSLPSLPRESDAYGSVLLPLYAAFSQKKANISPEEFEQGCKVLQYERQILRETGIQPGILGTLDELKPA